MTLPEQLYTLESMGNGDINLTNEEALDLLATLDEARELIIALFDGEPVDQGAALGVLVQVRQAHREIFTRLFEGA